MTENIVTRIRTVFEDTPEVLSTLDVETYEGAEAHTHMLGMWETMKEAADRIEELEEALGALWWGVGENGAPDELLEKTKDALKGTKYE
jgi:RPA family protein